MSIKLKLPKLTDLRPKLTVIGVGGAGCNAVNNMIAAGLNGVDFVVANTDAQALAASSAEHRVQLGVNLTEGLGAGARPEIGEAAAEEAIEDIRAQLIGSHMVFIAAGMGGGTGTGAATVIARASKEAGILTVGVVTKPFQFEGARRMRIAEAGIAELRGVVDTLIVIPNQNLFRIASEKTTFAEAFVLADQVLYSGVACIVDLIVKEGLINLDFADVRTIMSGMGTAMMGTGEASGERRAIIAAEEAISNPLLDDVSLAGAKGLLLSITGGPNLTLYEVDEAASRVRREVDADANIIVGATFDDTLSDRVRVSIVASGMSRLSEAVGGTNSTDSWQRSGRRPAMEIEPALAQPAESAPAAAREFAHQQRDDDEVQRRLSAALQPQEATSDYGYAYGSQTPAPAAEPPPVPQQDSLGLSPFGLPSAAAAVESWRAPGDVTIEEGLPALRGSSPPARRQPEAPPALPPSTTFVPAPPVELPRGQRRMPQVEDFPTVGQREFRAKAQAPAPVAPPPESHGESSRSARDSQPQRRPSFFERLTGRRRRDNDSVASGGDGQRDPDTYAGRSDGFASPSGHGQVAQPPRYRGSNRTQEEPELPVFFNRDRR